MLLIKKYLFTYNPNLKPSDLIKTLFESATIFLSLSEAYLLKLRKIVALSKTSFPKNERFKAFFEKGKDKSHSQDIFKLKVLRP